jgi:predicted secreted Zn-dependent protease
VKRAIGVAVAVASAVPAVAAPIFDDSVVEYTVTGRTMTQIRASIAAADAPTEGWAAYTKWRVRAKWTSHWADDSLCHIDHVTVYMTTVTTLPTWSQPARAPASTVRNWEYYIGNLREHEAGHLSIDQQAAFHLEHALLDVPPSATCSAVDALGEQAIDDVVDATRTDNAHYDLVTHHGSAQFAWPEVASP